MAEQRKTTREEQPGEHAGGGERRRRPRLSEEESYREHAYRIGVDAHFEVVKKPKRPGRDARST